MTHAAIVKILKSRWERPLSKALARLSILGWHAMFALAYAGATPETVGSSAGRPLPTSSAFYNLHQAVGFFEAYEGGHCEAGLDRAKTFLKRTRVDVAVAPDDGLKAIADKLESLVRSGEHIELVQIERIREQIHALATAHHYKHSESWNQAFLRCGENQMDRAVSN